MSVTVLVLCTGNSARSVMGEAILNKMGDGYFTAYSAGSRPTGRVNPSALRTLSAKGYETSHFYSKSWDEFSADDAPKMDLVITVCSSAAGESCPIWPMKEGEKPVRVHLGFPDPADFGDTDAVRDAAFEKVYQAEYKVFEDLLALNLKDLPKEDWAAAISTIDVPDVTL